MRASALIMILSSGLCAFLLFYLGAVAKRIGLVDIPDARKQHDQPVQLVGGLAIWGSLITVGLLVPASLGEFRILLFCVFLILITGLLDDYKEIQPTIRIIVQVICGFVLVYFGGSVVTSLGEVFFLAKPYGLGLAAIPFSIIAVVGTINAFNMCDGHDGLAGSLLLIGFGSLTILAVMNGSAYAVMLAIIALTLVPFLIFNLGGIVGKNRQVFLGDAGSMSLGLLAVFFLIELSKVGTGVVKVTAAPWLIALPLLDMMGVMIFRIKRNKSPFQPDRFHIHHLLIDLGWSKNKVLSVLVLVQLGFALIGIVGTLCNWNDGVLMWSAFGVLFLYLGVIARLREYNA